MVALYLLLLQRLAIDDVIRWINVWNRAADRDLLDSL